MSIDITYICTNFNDSSLAATIHVTCGEDRSPSNKPVLIDCRTHSHSELCRFTAIQFSSNEIRWDE